MIVNYKTAELTIACLRSLAREVAADSSIGVVVVDNASGDGAELAAAIANEGWGHWVELTLAECNGGFSYGNNRGVEPAMQWLEPPDYFLLLNPDTEVRPGAVRALVDHMDKHSFVGIAGSSFENPDGTEWPLAFRFPTLPGQFAHGIGLGLVSRLLSRWIVPMQMNGQAQQVDWVSGACFMVRRQVFEQVGLMDEGYFLYFEEVDFCLQARRAGWPCWYVPASRVMHISGQSTGVAAYGATPRRMPEYWFASRNRYFVKNHGLAYARLTDIAFGLGRAIWTMRHRLTGRFNDQPPHMLRDFWRTSVLFKDAAAVSRWIDARARI